MSLTKDCFLPHLLQLSKPASLLASIAFYWDPKRGEYVQMSNKAMFRHKVTTKIHALSVLTMLLQTFIFWEKDFSKVLISSFGLIVIYFTLITVWVYHIHLNRAIRTINDLIRASQEFKDLEGDEKIPLDTKEKLINFMAPLFHWSAMAVPFAFVGGVVWSMPCLNSSFGYYILEECSEGSSASPPLSIKYVLFIGINLLLWSYSIQCAVFVVIGVEMLGAMSIRSFLKFYERAMLNLTKKPMNANSNFANSQSQKLFKTAIVFRRIQLMTEALNSVHSTWVLVPLLFTVSSHQVFSMFGAIKFKGQLNFMSYCLFAILANQGVLVIMGMFTALGDVFRMSMHVKMKLEKAHRGHKWLRRFHKGCSLVRIRFGALNYVDSMTPLMFENFALSQTANMLLMN